MKLVKISFLLFVSCSYLACASQPPRPDNNNSSAVSITFTVHMHTRVLTWEKIIPEKVFFVKLDENKSLKQNNIFYSNKILQGTSCLFNAEPGKYAAVGAYGLGRFSEKDIFVLFPESMVKATIVDVKPGHFSYMGDFIMDMAPMTKILEKADHIQLYYHKLLSGIRYDSDSNLEYVFGAKYAIPAMKEKHIDAVFKIKHLKERKKEIENLQWKKAIDSEIIYLETNKNN